jgi:hypothetical protein
MTLTPEPAACGPCPISPCDWDLEGTLDEHLFTQHDEEQLSKALVRVALDNDQLRSELEHERKRVAYWQECRDNYAAENKRLIGEKKQLRAELAAVRTFADQDQDGATCPHNVTGQLRHILSSETSGEAWPLPDFDRDPEASARLAVVLAKASETRWRVYSFDAGDWMPTGSACDSPDEARRKQQQLASRFPDMPTAVVRESRTYQTEEA